MSLDSEDLNPTDVAILDELQRGRCTPAFIAERRGYSSGNIRNRMTHLASHDHIEGIGGGLYELVDDPRKDALTDAQLDRLEAEARERWGDEWAIKITHWADGDRHAHAVHIEPTEDPDVQLKDRLFVGADGEIYHDRIRVEREHLLEVVERDEPPEGIASEFIHEE